MAKVKIEQKPLWIAPSEDLTSGNYVSLINCFIDESGNIVSVPGYEVYRTLDSGLSIKGLLWYKRLSKLICVSGKYVYIIDSSGTITKCTGDIFTNNSKVILVDAGDFIYGVDGLDYIIKIDPILYKTTKILKSGVFKNVIDIKVFGQYMLVVNEKENKFYFSATGNYTSWTTTDFLSAESNNDYIIRLETMWNELYLFGTNTIEVWFNDPTTTFTRYDGAYSDVGTLSKDSIVQIENSFFFLSSDGMISEFNGRNRSVVSTQINSELSKYTNIKNSFGFKLHFHGRYFYCISFLDNKVTWAYDTMLKRWFKLGFYDTSNAEYKVFAANNAAIDENNTITYIGDIEDTGNIYRLSTDIYKDSASFKRCEIETGSINHGTYGSKKSSRITFDILRGKVNELSDSDIVSVRFQDENKSWSNSVNFHLGNAGDSNLVAFRRLGIYRSRKYKFVYTGNTPFVMSIPEEEIELLGR